MGASGNGGLYVEEGVKGSMAALITEAEARPSLAVQPPVVAPAPPPVKVRP